MAAEPGRITVSEDRLRLVLAEFKLELVKELERFVSRSDHESLDNRVKTLEIWRATVSGGEQERRVWIDSRRFVYGLAVTAVAGLLAAVATLVWLAVGG